MASISDSDLDLVLKFIGELREKLRAPDTSADGVANLNQWIDREVANEEHAGFVTSGAAAEIARGAALQVIADKATLIRNLENAGYVVTEKTRIGYEFNLLAHLHRQRKWSEKTFGPGERTKGTIEHIRKELVEIEADPTDLTEWIDVATLALDGAWRSAGADPHQIIAAWVAKTNKNEGRVWPDWRTVEPGKPIEHDRNFD